MCGKNASESNEMVGGGEELASGTERSLQRLAAPHTERTLMPLDRALKGVLYGA